MCTYQLCGRAVRENFCLEVMVHERTEGQPKAATNRRQKNVITVANSNKGKVNIDLNEQKTNEFTEAREI